jgi:hypothetical protein
VEELKEKLIVRGQKFEQMCNAKTEDRFRRYGGPVMKEGEIEMLGEGGGDVRFPNRQKFLDLLTLFFYGSSMARVMTICPIRPLQ